MIIETVAIIVGIIWCMYDENRMSREDAKRDYLERVALGQDPEYVAWSINNAVDDTASLETANRVYKQRN